MLELNLPWEKPEEFVKDTEKVLWTNRIIEEPPLEEHLIDLFCIEMEWRDYSAVELDSVIGSLHPNYQGYTWGWLLRYGKRMGKNLELLVRNPAYYFSSEKKLPSMSYLNLEGKYYVYYDGNHRTCIAKFLFPLLNRENVFSGVEVYRKDLDFNAYRAWKKLGGPEGKVLVEKKKISREDGSGWMREEYELRFTVFKGRKCYQNLTSNELIELSRERERSFLTKVRLSISKLFGIS